MTQRSPMVTSGHERGAVLQRSAKVSVVIPAMNEARNLPHVLPRIPSWVHEILLVDGHSTDETVVVAQRLCPAIRIIQQQGRGKGAALRTGFAAVTGDIIVMLDADGSTDPQEMGRFVRYLRDGADFVKGSRFLQGAGTSDMQLLRHLGNAALTRLVRLLFGGSFTDLCYGYNAFWTQILPLLALDSDGFEIETLMNVRALRAGLKMVEVHSYEAERIHGSSNLRTFRDGWRVLKTIGTEWWKTGPRPNRPSQPTVVLYTDLADGNDLVLDLGADRVGDDTKETSVP